MMNQVHQIRTTETNGQPAIEVAHLHKTFGTQVVLNGISLKVSSGETLVILGRSGTGKSVLLKLIIGLQEPDSGSIRIRDVEIVGLPIDELNEIRKKVGFSFQYSALYDSLTVEENVAFPLERHTELEPAERKERVQHLLAQVGIEKEAWRKLPGQISGGMKKRVGLARALALDPDIMLFDEPTAGLDPITAGEIDHLIGELQKERKVASMIVTHDLHCARAVSDRVALLHEGNVIVEGSIEELEVSENPFVSRFLTQSL